MELRFAHPNDAARICEIYAPYVLNTCVSFEYEPPSADAMTKRMEGIMNTYPYLVCEGEGRVIGYAYASRYRERAAFQFHVETSVYVDNCFHGNGVGRALYSALLEILHKQGVVSALASLGMPNPGSEAFHISMGFERFATVANAGYKHAEWHDVLWLRKELRPLPTSPAAITPIAEVDAAFIKSVLERYSR